MGKNIYVITHFVTILLYIIELIISLKIVKQKNASILMRNFYLYPLVGCIIGTIFLLKYLNITSNYHGFIANTISLIFHFSFLSYFIFSVTGKKNIFKIIFCFFITITIALVISDIKTGYGTSFAFANSCLFCFSLYYFLQILYLKEKINLSDNPIFFVCCGIFLGTGLIVPSSLMIKYSYLIKIGKDSIYVISATSGAGRILLDLFFIKALLCITQNK